jgi:hypothetical protein
VPTITTAMISKAKKKVRVRKSLRTLCIPAMMR